MTAIASGKLAKATLIHQPRETSKDIEFMFNPTELSFQRSVRLNSSEGARTEKGLSKISFAYPDPCTLSLSNIVFDTYEQGQNVLDSYINKLIQAVSFVDSGSGAGQRPPIYIFTWGSQQYLRCFVEQLSYKLTLFLADGTPVQAKADLTLKEIDESGAKASSDKPTSPQRNQDSRANRSAARGN